MTLYQIADDLRALGDLLAESAGEVTPESEAALSEFEREIETDLVAKVDAYCSLIRELEQRASVRLVESTRLRKLADADNAAAERLRERLRFVFAERGIGPMQTPRFRVRLSRNGGKAPIQFSPWVAEAPERLPEEFRAQLWKVRTDAIREALEAGRHLDFANLGDRGTRIDIR
jgi:hypothetical protein